MNDGPKSTVAAVALLGAGLLLRQAGYRFPPSSSPNRKESA